MFLYLLACRVKLCVNHLYFSRLSGEKEIDLDIWFQTTKRSLLIYILRYTGSFPLVIPILSSRSGRDQRS